MALVCAGENQATRSRQNSGPRRRKELKLPPQVSRFRLQRPDSSVALFLGIEYPAPAKEPLAFFKFLIARIVDGGFLPRGYIEQARLGTIGGAEIISRSGNAGIEQDTLFGR